MNPIPKIMTLFLFALFSSATVANTISFASGEYQNTLIELYTSEGCSSCPPAERWLNSLKDHPELFSKIIPLAFHVDYWNYLGWRDVFAKPEYSQRQQQHYQQQNLSQVYTPGVLKNGQEYRQWARELVLPHGEKVGQLHVEVIEDQVNIAFHPHQPSKPLVAHVALLGFGFKSQVSSGENVGKTLTQDFVVLELVKQTSAVNRWSMGLPHSTQQAKQHALAVWLSKPNSSKPIQATASWLK